jgi:hypothetical protein
VSVEEASVGTSPVRDEVRGLRSVAVVVDKALDGLFSVGVKVKTTPSVVIVVAFASRVGIVSLSVPLIMMTPEDEMTRFVG